MMISYPSAEAREQASSLKIRESAVGAREAELSRMLLEAETRAVRAEQEVAGERV